MRISVLPVVLSLCLTVSATTQHEVFKGAVPFSSADELGNVQGLDKDKATLDNPAAARTLIEAMKANVLKNNTKAVSCPLTLEETKQKGKDKRDSDCLPVLDGQHLNTYVLIHLLRWEDSSTPDKPKVRADHWYLYRDDVNKWSQEDFTTTKRLSGVKRVYVLYVHFKGKQVGADGKPTNPLAYVPDDTPNYDFAITKKAPANIAHLYALLQAYTSGASAGKGAEIGGAVATKTDAAWGGGILNLQYIPSDIQIKSTFKVNADDSDQKLADDITFDNEGAYYWDVGFAVPVRKISELKLDTTSGTATPAKVNSQNVFAVLDGYLRPVDVKGSAFSAIPHPIAGVAFAKQPLSKILIGGAWGPKASELYMGAIFVKQPGLSGSNSCSNPSGSSLTGKSHYCTQFTIGINLSVSAIASKLGAPK
jgi:hypothetical protein